MRNGLPLCQKGKSELNNEKLAVQNKRPLLSVKPKIRNLPHHALRFAIAFILSCAKVLGGLSPFGTAFASALSLTYFAPSAILGASLGYAASNGLGIFVKYTVSSLLVLAAVRTFSKIKSPFPEWLSPCVSFTVMLVMSAAFGFIGNESVDAAILCFADAFICAAGTYFFRKASGTPSLRLDFVKSSDVTHTVSVIVLLAAMIITLCPVRIFRMISIGRILALMCVIVFSYKGGVIAGTSVGICFGLAIDASFGLFWFTGAYGLVGLVGGALSKQSKALFILSAVLVNAALAVTSLGTRVSPACLYEMFIVSVLFVLIPNSLLNKLEAYLPSSVSSLGQMRSRQYITVKLKKASEAFEMLFNTVCTASGANKNDSDIAAIFDRTAEKICRTCRLSSVCWVSDYQTTLNALNSISSEMLQKVKMSVDDLPDYFRSSCCDAYGFIDALNEELRGYAYRKQYKARLLNSQKAAFGQYEDIAGILSDFSAQLEHESICEPLLENRLKKYLISLGIAGDVAVYRGARGRLRAEISKEASSKLRKRRNYLAELAGILGAKIICGDEADGFDTYFSAEPYSASVGIASIGKHHSAASGDRGAYFKTDAGLLHVILSDGMGSGKEAEKYSKQAVSILESFLGAGVAADSAMRILNDLMLLKNQDDTDCCTIDLISIDLFTGKSEMFKYGAAASYLKTREEVSRMTGKSLACGLGYPPEDSPDRFDVKLSDGCFAVMVSDGVTSDGQDTWIFDLLHKFSGTDPRELAKLIVQTAQKRYGEDDDMTALVVHFEKRV